MMQKDKELLLKDLCARLTCRTMVKCNTDGRHEFDEVLSLMHIMNFYQFDTKPYLRSMSNMTDNERKEYSSIVKNIIDFYDCPKHEDVCFSIMLIDWLNAHHFDYRGLIEKGLALEAPKDMYN